MEFIYTKPWQQNYDFQMEYPRLTDYDGANTRPSQALNNIQDRYRMMGYDYSKLRDLMGMMQFTHPEMQLEDIIRGTLLKDMNTQLQDGMDSRHWQLNDLYMKTMRQLGINPNQVQRFGPPTTGSKWM